MRLEKSEQYKEFFKPDYMMGPNSLRLLDEAMSTVPLERCRKTGVSGVSDRPGVSGVSGVSARSGASDVSEVSDRSGVPGESEAQVRGGSGQRILDLGCGTGITSLFLARETGAQVFAVDLWCSATDNQKRMEAWGVGEQVVPLHADANDLPFAEGYFDAVVSIDSYHYFAREASFFKEKVLPFVKSGGQVLIAIPGLKEEFGETVPKEMTDWAGEEWEYFHSPAWWKKTIGESEQIESVKTWELECFDLAWEEWFATGAEYAVRDQEAFGKGLGQYLNFVGIAVKKISD